MAHATGGVVLDINPASTSSVGRSRISAVGRDGAGWQGFVLVSLGWVGVGVAHPVSGLSPDPTSMGATLWAVGLACTSLAAIGGGAAIAIAAGRSPMRHVFQSRPLFGTAATLLSVAAVAVAVVIYRSPFDGIAAYGLPLADLINDVTLVAAALICAVGGTAALRAAWTARHDERSWGAQVSGSSGGTQRSG